jgi:hypothetical protein
MPNKYYTLSCCRQGTIQPQYSCHTCYPKQFELEIKADSFDWKNADDKSREKHTKLLHKLGWTNVKTDNDDLPF